MSVLMQELINNNTAAPMLQNHNQQKAQLKAAITQMRALQNPQQLQNLIMQNPNWKNALNFMKGFSSPENAFMALAQQNGYTPDEINELMR